MLACRACHRPLNSNEGCAICTAMKANLVTTEENTEEYPALSDVSSETVAALQVILKKHRSTLKNTKASAETLETAEVAVVRVANTLAKVLESARKLQQDGIAAVRNMSFNDRNILFATWYQSLPPLYRKKVQDGMGQFELKAAEPLQQLSAGDDDAGTPAPTPAARPRRSSEGGPPLRPEFHQADVAQRIA
jgi:hypothetical protein